MPYVINVHVKLNSFLKCGFAMAKGGFPERKPCIVATSVPLDTGPAPCTAVHRQAQHMVGTAGEQGGHAGLMRPFESLSSGTEDRVLQQAEQ